MVWVSFSLQIYSTLEFWRFKFSVVWVLVWVSSFYGDGGGSHTINSSQHRIWPGQISTVQWKWSPPSLGSLKTLLLPTVLNKVQNKGTQGVRARCDAKLPPFISIVQCPGRPVMWVPDFQSFSQGFQTFRNLFHFFGGSRKGLGHFFRLFGISGREGPRDPCSLSGPTATAIVSRYTVALHSVALRFPGFGAVSQENRATLAKPWPSTE